MPLQHRKDHLNYLKAFAAFLVVSHHAFSYSSIHSSSLLLQAVFHLITNVHVPLFFCIAGYLCHRQCFSSFYAKKIQRILIPFLFFSALKLVYTNIIDDSYSHASTFPLQFFDAFVMGSLYWFAYAILIMYAFAPFLWRMKKGNILLFIGLLAVGVILEKTGITLTNILQIRKTVSHACFFVGGYLLQQYEESFATFKKYKSLLFSIFLVLTAGILHFSLTNTEKLPYLLKVLFSFSQMFLLYTFATYLPRNITVLNYVGSHSLQIMFFDSFFKAVLFALIPAVNPLIVLGIIVLNVSLTCVATLILERIPYIKTLFGL